MNNSLKLLLLKMRDIDQEIRKRVGEELIRDSNFLSADHPLGSEMESIDLAHTQKMKEIVKEYGWPTISIVGKEASHAAWLLVQHARDIIFKEKCLELIRFALVKRDVRKGDYAYLYDRICVGKGKSQLYGTQFIGDKVSPIEDIEHLDERRKEFGLELFEKYKKFFDNAKK